MTQPVSTLADTARGLAVASDSSPPGGPVETALECVAFKPSVIHGWGCFARKPIGSGARVIEYLGQKIDKRESERRCRLNNEYIFYLDERFDLDGNAGWNPAKFINHSCSPNCDAELIDGKIWIVARRMIQPGEEISFNYGYDLEDYREHPCRCGSSNCVGYIVAEEFFEIVVTASAQPEIRRRKRRSGR